MNQIKVGLFLSVGLFVVAISIFLMGSNKSIFQKTIAIHSFYDSVQGLNKGGIVSLAGVKVGNVEAIDFDEEKNLVKVTFIIQEEYQKKIKIDSYTEIRTQGALGDKFVYIVPGQSTEIVTEGSTLKAEYGNDILSVLNKRGGESDKLFDALDDFKKLMAGLNSQNKIPSLIHKLDQAAGNLSESSALLNKSLKSGSIDRSMKKMENILDKIDNGEGTLGALINDRSVHERIKTLLGAGQKQQQVKTILKSSVSEE